MAGSQVMRAANVLFDAGMIVLCALLVIGGYLVAWADNRGLITGNQLFSVWALPLYAGFAAAAYVLFLHWTRRGRRAGAGLGSEYRFAVRGAALFIVALVGEFALRSVGEPPLEGPEAVLAPTRLGLFLAAILLLSGPILSISRRVRDETAAARVMSSQAALLAIAIGLCFSVLTLLTGFVHPFVFAAGSDEQTVPLGVAGIALQVLLLAGALLVTFRLAPAVLGVVTIVAAVDGALIAFIGAEPVFFVALLAAGIAGDVYMWRYGRRATVSPLALAVGMASVAALFFVGTYFVLLAVTRGIGWSPDLMVGSILLSMLLAAAAAAVVEWPRPGRADNRLARTNPADTNPADTDATIA